MKIIILFISVSCFWLPCAGQTSPSFFFEGQVKNQAGKAIRDAKLEILSLRKTFATDKRGSFFIALPKGDYLVRVSATDYKSKEIFIGLKKDTVIYLSLESIFGGVSLGEVEIKGRTSNKVNADVAGVEKLDRQAVDRMPALLGEKDPVKALQFLPGITGTTEGSAEMNVRGGGNDQNMIMLDHIPLYSSTHLFGLYSSFNPLAISSTTIYKGDFPASFGGRLSSVIDLVSSDTVAKTFSCVAELGITTAKAILAIPMLKQKSSLFLSGRRSYYDVLFKTFGKGNADIFKFQDYNINWIYQPDPKNKVKLTLYHESDAVGTVVAETGLSKGNSDKNQRAFGLNWKHSFNNTLSNDLTVYYNDFSNKLTEEKRNSEQSYLYHFKSSIADVGFNDRVNYTLPGLRLYAGVDWIRHTFEPARLSGEEDGQVINVENISAFKANDVSTFVGSQIDFGWNGKLNLGLRNNNYFTTDRNYHSLEPRLSYLQPIGATSSVRFSYSRMTQPVHRMNNPGLGLPQDIILSSDKDLKPQIADHFSIEFAKDFKFDEERFSFSLQPFYKKLHHILAFRDGYDTRSLMYGSIYQASSYNEVITTGNGKIFGIEMMLEKKTGKLNGWISYTFMKASNQFSELNGGLSFSPAQDRRHNFNVVANWQLSSKWNIGFSWTFISGQPVNVPESIFMPVAPNYTNGNLDVTPSSGYLFEQGKRGGYRMKPFHKLDITAEYKFKLAGLDARWNIGAYNVYNRLNPSFYYLGKYENTRDKIRQPVLKSVSLFPIMPSASLSVRF